MDKVLPSECTECGYEYNRHKPTCSKRHVNEMPMPEPGHADIRNRSIPVIWQWYGPGCPIRPPQIGKFVVIVDHGRFGLTFVTTRTWSGKEWLHTGPHDVITHWLDGLEMPY